jgi:hypothetical protein
MAEENETVKSIKIKLGNKIPELKETFMLTIEDRLAGGLYTGRIGGYHPEIPLATEIAKVDCEGRPLVRIWGQNQFSDQSNDPRAD